MKTNLDLSTLPILHIAGMTGSIDKERMVDILNDVQLNFFDRDLKDKPANGELFHAIPEIYWLSEEPR